MDELGPFKDIPGKLDGIIVSHEVIDALSGIEFYRETPGRPAGIRGPPVFSQNGKMDKNLGSFSRPGKKGGAGVLRHGPDHLKDPVNPNPLGMDPRGKLLPVKKAVPSGGAALSGKTGFRDAGPVHRPAIDSGKRFHVFLKGHESPISSIWRDIR
jgi:phosphoribosyl 1,2-cyclic phosphodiesterase